MCVYARACFSHVPAGVMKKKPGLDKILSAPQILPTAQPYDSFFCLHACVTSLVAIYISSSSLIISFRDLQYRHSKQLLPYALGANSPPLSLAKFYLLCESQIRKLIL
jgi:hypothetical protein